MSTERMDGFDGDDSRDLATVKAIQRMCQKETSGRLTNHGERLGQLEKQMAVLDKGIELMKKDLETLTKGMEQVSSYVTWGTRIFVGACVTSAGALIMERIYKIMSH